MVVDCECVGRIAADIGLIAQVQLTSVNLQETISSLKAEAKGKEGLVQQKYYELRNQKTTAESKLGNLEKQFAEIQSKFNELEKKNQQLNNENTELQSKFTELGSSITEYEREKKTLEMTLGHIASSRPYGVRWLFWFAGDSLLCTIY